MYVSSDLVRLVHAERLREIERHRVARIVACCESAMSRFVRRARSLFTALDASTETR